MATALLNGPSLEQVLFHDLQLAIANPVVATGNHPVYGSADDLLITISGRHLTYSQGEITGGVIASITFTDPLGSYTIDFFNDTLLDEGREYQPDAAAIFALLKAGDNDELAALLLHGADGVAGDDTDNAASGRHGSDYMAGYGGDDRLDGGDGADTVLGGVGDDALSGGNGVDMLIGEAGSDVLHGGATSDTLYGGAGADYLGGDGGDDYAVYDFGAQGATASVVFDGGAVGTGNILSLDDGTGSKDVLVSIEGLILTGSDFADTMKGGTGDDIITAGAGDAIDGRKGSDTAIVSADGHDAAITATLSTNGKLTITSADHGFDVRGYGIEHLDMTGGSGADTITGGKSGDTLVGGAGGDRLTGGRGDDIIDGGAGVDMIDGGTGYDRYDVTPLDLQRGHTIDLSRFDPTAAEGRVRDSSGSIDLLHSIEGFVLNGGYFTDSLTGSVGDDIIDGGYGADTIDGGAGNDLILAPEQGLVFIIDESNENEDELAPDEGNDSFSGGAGNDTLSFAGVDADMSIDLRSRGARSLETGFDRLSGIENVIGGNGDDYIRAGTKGAELGGGSGDDTLMAGEGRDTLTGGAGDDTYLFLSTDRSSGAVSKADLITDFTGSDRIDVSQIDGNTRLAGHQGFRIVDAFGANPAGVTDGQITLHYDKASDTTIVSFNTDGDRAAEMVILLAGRNDGLSLDHGFIL